MSTWYKVSSYSQKIDPVEVERATDQFVWVRGRREGKQTSWGAYFNSWDAAHNHLLQQAEREVFSARRSLELAKSFEGNVRGMKPTVQT